MLPHDPVTAIRPEIPAPPEPWLLNIPGLVEPDPLQSHVTDLSEYFLVQALSRPDQSVVLGRISDVFDPDQTMIGDSYKYYFANFNFNKNPMTTNFYHPTAWAALGMWAPVKSLH